MYQYEVRSVRVDCAFSSMVTRRMPEADDVLTGVREIKGSIGWHKASWTVRIEAGTCRGMDE